MSDWWGWLWEVLWSWRWVTYGQKKASIVLLGVFWNEIISEFIENGKRRT